MKDVFQSDRAHGAEQPFTVAEVLDACGLSTPASRGLAAVIRHPLGMGDGTMVIEEDLAGEEEEFGIVRLVMASGRDAVCVRRGEDADGSGELFVVQVGDEDAWIGYCRVSAASRIEQAVLIPVRGEHDFHFAVDPDGRLERRAGRPAVNHAFGYRIAAARLARAAAEHGGAGLRAAA